MKCPRVAGSNEPWTFQWVRKYEYDQWDLGDPDEVKRFPMWVKKAR